MMKDYVTDTHTLYWYFIASPKLGPSAKDIFDEARDGSAFIHISAIVLAELYFLNVKLGHPIDFGDMFNELAEGSQYVLTSLDPEDVMDFENDRKVKEMHDRIIVGLARRLNAPLLTVDKDIIASGLVTII
jgi:PIN domain nuclease of toxin-antitoxin system